MNERRTTLALLPGLDGTGIRFKPFIAALPPSLPVHVVAYPTSASWSVEEYARFAATRLPSGPLVIFAESFSGLVALELLRSRQANMKALILCASFAEPVHPWLLQLLTRIPGLGSLVRNAPDFMWKLCGTGFHVAPGQLQLLREAIEKLPSAVLVHRLRLVASQRSSLREETHVPCYYLQAVHDRLVPAHAATWFEHRFKSFHLIQIDGPHAVVQTAARECARWVADIMIQIENC